MSAVKVAQDKVQAKLAEADGELVAEFDFSILITMALQLLMQYLGSCLNVDPAKAMERAEDSFFYGYFARRAAKDAVKQRYGKHKRRDDAADLLSESLCCLTPEERVAAAEEMRQAEEDAGLLI